MVTVIDDYDAVVCLNDYDVDDGEMMELFVFLRHFCFTFVFISLLRVVGSFFLFFFQHTYILDSSSFFSFLFAFVFPLKKLVIFFLLFFFFFLKLGSSCCLLCMRFCVVFVRTISCWCVVLGTTGGLRQGSGGLGRPETHRAALPHGAGPDEDQGQEVHQDRAGQGAKPGAP